MIDGPIETLQVPIAVQGSGRACGASFSSPRSVPFSRPVLEAASPALRMQVSRPAAKARGTLLLVHGLAGCAASPYLRWTGNLALARGWCIARLDLRGCGGTEALSLSLHNAAQSEDIDAALGALERAELPRPYAVAGFSLGANLVLRALGCSGAASLADRAVAVNPPVDLAACADALERPSNLLYQAYFLRRLCHLVRCARTHFEVPGPEASPWRIRTVRRFDTLFTAPSGGFTSVEEYYEVASSGRVIAGVRRPTLVLSAQDDPFVPYTCFPPCHAAAPDDVRFIHPKRGGHVGYWQSAATRFWAAEAIVAFIASSSPILDAAHLTAP